MRFLPIPALVVVLAAATPALADEPYRHSIDVSPLSPILKIWGGHYGYLITDADELQVGAGYMNISYEDSGSTHATALILGYRRYLWRGLNLEYQLWPIYDDYWESNERRYYSSFDVWNEARLGYRFDIDAWGLPLTVTPQLAFGFGLYASNKPESFKEQEKDNRFFKAPLLFCGARF